MRKRLWTDFFFFTFFSVTFFSFLLLCDSKFQQWAVRVMWFIGCLYNPPLPTVYRHEIDVLSFSFVHTLTLIWNSFPCSKTSKWPPSAFCMSFTLNIAVKTNNKQSNLAQLQPLSFVEVWRLGWERRFKLRGYHGRKSLKILYSCCLHWHISKNLYGPRTRDWAPLP